MENFRPRDGGQGFNGWIWRDTNTQAITKINDSGVRVDKMEGWEMTHRETNIWKEPGSHLKGCFLPNNKGVVQVPWSDHCPVTHHLGPLCTPIRQDTCKPDPEQSLGVCASYGDTGARGWILSTGHGGTEQIPLGMFVKTRPMVEPLLLFQLVISNTWSSGCENTMCFR